MNSAATKSAAIGPFLCTVLPASPATWAHAPKAKPAALHRPHRQLADCMSRRMSADRTLSYYVASKSCKEWLRSEAGHLTASNGVRAR